MGIHHNNPDDGAEGQHGSGRRGDKCLLSVYSSFDKFNHSK